MTAGYMAALYMSDFHWHNFIANEGDNPANRAQELEFFIAPAHSLRIIQSGHHSSKYFRKYFDSRTTFIYHMGINIIVLHFHGRYIHMLSTGKPLQRSGRIAILIISCLYRRTSLIKNFIRLLFCCAGNISRQSARCCVNLYIFKRKAGFCQFLFCQSLKLTYQRRHDIGRHFLGSNFQQ